MTDAARPQGAAAVRRLVTRMELADAGTSPRRMSIAARQEAELPDGRRVPLLDDRGWTSELRGGPAAEVPAIWAVTPVAEVERTARVVVGPDEPRAGASAADEAAAHWASLAGVLRRQGIAIDPAALALLPHDVELGPRLRARLGADAVDAG